MIQTMSKLRNSVNPWVFIIPLEIINEIFLFLFSSHCDAFLKKKIVSETTRKVYLFFSCCKL